MARKYSKGASKDVESAMHRKKAGTLKSGKGGKGGKAKSRAQAVAIGLSEARKKGAKVPAARKSKTSGRRKSSGAKSKRFSLPNSRIVIHQPLMSGLAGQATDLDIAAREILRMRERINAILVHHTGQPEKRIQEDTERDYITTTDQGKEYGIIDDFSRKRA